MSAEMSAETFAMPDAIGQCPAWARSPIAASISAASISMTFLSRRSFLAGSAVMSAAPALAQPPGLNPQPAPRQKSTPRPDGVDVVIVGAGAAGIAAARRLVAAGRRFVVLEAAGPHRRALLHRHELLRRAVMTAARTGSTCRTSIRSPSSPPQTGLDIYPAPPGQRCASAGATRAKARWRTISRRWCGPTAHRTRRARKGDISCAQALPKDLGDWQQTIEFVLGPFGCGKDLAEVSALDFSRSAERDVDAFCRQGFGALIAKLAARAAGAALRTRSRRSTVARPRQSKSGPRAAAHGARGDRDGVDRRAARQDQVRAGAAAGASSMRCAGSRSAATTTSRWSCRAIRSGCSATSWCSRNRAAARTGAHLRQCVGHHAVHGRGRRQVRPRSRRQGRAGDGRRSRSTGSTGLFGAD